MLNTLIKKRWKETRAHIDFNKENLVFVKNNVLWIPAIDVPVRHTDLRSADEERPT